MLAACFSQSKFRCTAEIPTLECVIAVLCFCHGQQKERQAEFTEELNCSLKQANLHRDGCKTSQQLCVSLSYISKSSNPMNHNEMQLVSSYLGKIMRDRMPLQSVSLQMFT